MDGISVSNGCSSSSRSNRSNKSSLEDEDEDEDEDCVRGVTVLAATNRLSSIDSALLRKGTYVHRIYIGIWVHTHTHVHAHSYHTLIPYTHINLHAHLHRYTCTPIHIHQLYIRAYAGRFHHVLLVPAPDEATRISLLHHFARRSGLEIEGELVKRMQEEVVGIKGEGKSGAVIENMCREAVMSIVRKGLS